MTSAAVMTRARKAPSPQTILRDCPGAVLQGRVLGRLGGFEVRLAASAGDLRLAQALRYRVFYEERGLPGTLLQQLTRLDEDRFDRFCDHLLLVDAARAHTPQEAVVGTYRLLTQGGARRAGGFYSQSEFDVAALLARHPGRRFLELGRSCSLPEYRGRRTMELLWHGIWAYVLEKRIDVLFGCASLPGTNLSALAEPLGFLGEKAIASPEWHVTSAGGRGVALPAGGTLGDLKGLACLPPLVKAYLRVGGMVSSEAVVDHEFGTTDVFLVLPTERIAPRYVAHYGAGAERFC